MTSTGSASIIGTVARLGKRRGRSDQGRVMEKKSMAKKYKISRSELDSMKKKYGMTDESDREFLEWWRRNHGTGYEAFHLIEITKG